MKTQKELAAIREEFISLRARLAELTDDELTLVTGGTDDRTRKDLYENIILGAGNNDR